MNKEQIRRSIIKRAHQRYATKKYNPNKHISDEDWQTILEVARLSPSSFGYEPWKFLLLNNQEDKDAIRPFSWGVANSLDGADKILIILARKGVSYDSQYVQHLVNDIKHKHYSPDSQPSLHFKAFQERDLAIKNEGQRFEWAVRQTYIAMADMMTAATELGIDSCPLEGFNYAKMNDFLTQKGYMDPEKWGVAVLVSFGYRDQDVTPKVRQPLTDIYKELN